MEDAVARESGRVSHPHKGKEPSPPRPPLPATPRGTGRRLGTSLLRVAFGVRLGSAGGGDFLGDGVNSLGGWRLKSQASLALDVILLGICPFEF